jgi:GxxExxY protein
MGSGYEFSELTQAVIGAVFEVSNTLGTGFLEKVYENALARELSLRGVRVTAQASLAVWYKGYSVGKYQADLLVEGGVDCGVEVRGAVGG